MITAIILNWKRINNVRRIVTEMQAEDLINQIFVINNNPDVSKIPLNSLYKVTFFHHSRDVGLLTRFSHMQLAANNCVLFQDDDISCKSYKHLYEKWRIEPHIIHGKFGRRARKDGTYATDVRGDGKYCPIVLTRLMIVHRDYGHRFFAAYNEWAECTMQGARPRGNGEDILMSYVVRRQSGILNRVHAFPTHELPAPNAIHGRWHGHVNYRTKLMQECESWLQPECS